MADIYKRTFTDIPESEAVRYLGYGSSRPDLETVRLIHACMDEINSAADYSAVRLRLPVCFTDGGTHIGDSVFPGSALKKCLFGSEEVFLTAMTLGPSVDRLISVLRYREPSKALVMDACANAAIEAFADGLNEEWRISVCAEGRHLKPRFSPGYGDLPLIVQKDLIRMLDAAHLIGISLTDSYMMIPRKSVSAVIGIADGRKEENITGCSTCGKTDCSFRREQRI